jgi:hypothetical protein
VIDVEQRALRALEQHALAGFHRAIEVQRDVAHQRLQARPEFPEIGEHVLPAHVGIAARRLRTSTFSRIALASGPSPVVSAMSPMRMPRRAILSS